VRILDQSWRNLAPGMKTAASLEAKLPARWSRRFDEAEQQALVRAKEAHDARRAAGEREWAQQLAACQHRNRVGRERFAEHRAGWLERDMIARQRFAEEKAAWSLREEPRRKEFDALLRDWSAQRAARRRELSRLAAIATSAWLLIALVSGMIAGALSVAHAGVAGAAALVAGAVLLGPSRHLLAHRAERPVYPQGDPEPAPRFEPEPVYAGDESPPPRPAVQPAKVMQPRTVALEILGPWWERVEADGGARADDGHGAEGVERFTDILWRKLPHDFFAAQELLVSKSLDVDVLVVGPSGIWLFEVKHWSGHIVCRNGSWRRERTYFAAGGVEKTEVKEFEGFDRQWQRELDGVTTTLQRRLRNPVANALECRGGVVFSHPDVSWDLDSSCQSGYGPPSFWADTVAQAPALPGFDTYERLRVLDALFTWSRKLQGDGDARCAETLVQDLHDAINQSANGYIRRLAHF